MNMETLYLLLVFLLLLSVIVSCTIIIVGAMRNLTDVIGEKNDMQMQKMLFDAKFDADQFSLLDNLINENIARYQVFNHSFDPEVYINEKEQEKMIKEILKEVLTQMSPMYREHLTLIYNPAYIEDIIYQKITMAIISYSVDINGSFSKEG